MPPTEERAAKIFAPEVGGKTLHSDYKLTFLLDASKIGLHENVNSYFVLIRAFFLRK